MITKSTFFTVVSPVILFLCYLFGCFVLSLESPFSRIAFIMPYIFWEVAIAEFASKLDIIIGIISSILTFIITIGASMLYLKYEDIK